MTTTPSFVAGLSQVRPERLIRVSEALECFKQRRVDLLTKSSLRLLLDRTVVYIQQDSEISGKTGNGGETGRRESNRIEWK